MAIHDQRPHANLIVTDDIYVATELSDMESLADSDEGQAIFYVGHSGWGPGQLETRAGRRVVAAAARRRRIMSSATAT